MTGPERVEEAVRLEHCARHEIPWVVTTGQNTTAALCRQAQEIADGLNVPCVQRDNMALDDIKQKYNVATVIVVTKEKTIARTPEGDLFFHLNMAQLRIKQLERGERDHMLEAMELGKGMSLLDCTLGMATDAVVASYAGAAVRGVERSPVLAAIAAHGLKSFPAKSARLKNALQGIEVITAEYLAYLRTLPACSFDIVYFDPMFRHPLDKSLHLQPLRFFADHRALSAEAVAEAKRVAKRCVVMKETNGSLEFSRLGFLKTVGGKYSSIRYGVIRVNE